MRANNRCAMGAMVNTLVTQVQAMATTGLKSQAGRQKRVPNQTSRTAGIWIPTVGVNATNRPTAAPRAM